VTRDNLYTTKNHHINIRVIYKVWCCWSNIFSA